MACYTLKRDEGFAMRDRMVSIMGETDHSARLNCLYESILTVHGKACADDILKWAKDSFESLNNR